MFKKKNKKVEFFLDHYEPFWKFHKNRSKKVALVTNGLKSAALFSFYFDFVCSLRHENGNLKKNAWSKI
jgi:hypothetical protein